MYSRLGPLRIPDTDQDFKNDWSREKRAMIRLCQIINQGFWKAFHPATLEEDLRRQNYRGKFFRDEKNVTRLLDRTYELALKKHQDSGSTGPLPNRIKIGFNSNSYFLQWETTNKEVTYTLFIFKLKADPTLRISGNMGMMAVNRALRKGLLGIQFMRKNWRPDTVCTYTVPEKKETRNILDVKVHLGDLLDFLKKYKQ